MRERWERFGEQHPRWHALGWYAFAIPMFFVVILAIPMALVVALHFGADVSGGLDFLPDVSDGTMKTIGITSFAVVIAFVAGQWYTQSRK